MFVCEQNEGDKINRERTNERQTDRSFIGDVTHSTKTGSHVDLVRNWNSGGGGGGDRRDDAGTSSIYIYIYIYVYIH